MYNYVKFDGYAKTGGPMKAWQPPLFPDETAEGQYSPSVSPPALTPRSSLSTAMEGFHNYMIKQGFTDNTIKAFLADLRLLVKYMGVDRPLGEIGTEDLNNYLAYLRYERGVPCTPKSYARRLTTLKVFFGWLTQDGILPTDPAAPIAHQTAKSPLPEILYDGQVEQLLAATGALMKDEKMPDARPHLLVTLLLHTGLKKSECTGIKLRHLDNSDLAQPVLYVRYEDPKKRHKERKLALPQEFAPTLRQYIEEYQPEEYLFECTARNLEYVLTAAAELAGLEDISFEGLRMTCAVRDYRAGMPSDKLRKKLGLSIITWRDKERQIQTLASTPL
jgi:site-specific recombinase XerD